MVITLNEIDEIATRIIEEVREKIRRCKSMSIGETPSPDILANNTSECIRLYNLLNSKLNYLESEFDKLKKDVGNNNRLKTEIHKIKLNKLGDTTNCSGSYYEQYRLGMRLIKSDLVSFREVLKRENFEGHEYEFLLFSYIERFLDFIDDKENLGKPFKSMVPKISMLEKKAMIKTNNDKFQKLKDLMKKVIGQMIKYRDLGADQAISLRKKGKTIIEIGKAINKHVVEISELRKEIVKVKEENSLKEYIAREELQKLRHYVYLFVITVNEEFYSLVEKDYWYITAKAKLLGEIFESDIKDYSKFFSDFGGIIYMCNCLNSLINLKNKLEEAPLVDLPKDIEFNFPNYNGELLTAIKKFGQKSYEKLVERNKAVKEKSKSVSKQLEVEKCITDEIINDLNYCRVEETDIKKSRDKYISLLSNYKVYCPIDKDYQQEVDKMLAGWESFRVEALPKIDEKYLKEFIESIMGDIEDWKYKVVDISGRGKPVNPVTKQRTKDLIRQHLVLIYKAKSLYEHLGYHMSKELIKSIDEAEVICTYDDTEKFVLNTTDGIKKAIEYSENEFARLSLESFIDISERLESLKNSGGSDNNNNNTNYNGMGRKLSDINKDYNELNKQFVLAKIRQNYFSKNIKHYFDDLLGKDCDKYFAEKNKELESEFAHKNEELRKKIGNLESESERTKSSIQALAGILMPLLCGVDKKHLKNSFPNLDEVNYLEIDISRFQIIIANNGKILADIASRVFSEYSYNSADMGLGGVSNQIRGIYKNNPHRRKEYIDDIGEIMVGVRREAIGIVRGATEDTIKKLEAALVTRNTGPVRNPSTNIKGARITGGVGAVVGAAAGGTGVVLGYEGAAAVTIALGGAGGAFIVGGVALLAFLQYKYGSSLWKNWNEDYFRYQGDIKALERLAETELTNDRKLVMNYCKYYIMPSFAKMLKACGDVNYSKHKIVDQEFLSCMGFKFEVILAVFSDESYFEWVQDKIRIMKSSEYEYKEKILSDIEDNLLAIRAAVESVRKGDKFLIDEKSILNAEALQAVTICVSMLNAKVTDKGNPYTEYFCMSVANIAKIMLVHDVDEICENLDDAEKAKISITEISRQAIFANHEELKGERVSICPSNKNTQANSR